ncbi:lactoylglutathione lyase [Pseudomonas duriflava]|uniref:Lactoylglutathione lyase n=2 Tax=Pseudomonas duriflava TaxID=459528 RepID=A0A562QLB7_9PSED|nr:lactoylglutathione lyase [Pseudomonas duriflava]
MTWSTGSPSIPRHSACICNVGYVAELGGAAVPVYLLQKAAGSETAGQVRHYRQHWTPIHLDLVVDDLDAALARVLAAGATLEGTVQRSAFRELATVRDPFGHGLCLLRFLSEPYRDGE